MPELAWHTPQEALDNLQVAPPARLMQWSASLSIKKLQHIVFMTIKELLCGMGVPDCS